ncbi:MAG TPA: type I-E CRISPR-associated protein Cse1/CasA, partial [Anaerolineae bacterium]|nr:type I-E CRISPR-associated protein Cse1/CasA [Anaerolineae bacterium]
MNQQPVFNLWSEPWITVERPSARLDTLSIEEALTQADVIHALYDPSPLAVTAVHRLLTAILQEVYAPRRLADLAQIWRDGRFLPDKIAAFGSQYASRFDLFAQDAPFLQTADLGLQPAKSDKPKPAAYLFQEQPAGTAVTHYTHAYDENQLFCAACAAKGLLLGPPFASSGGAGIKPSINGVPPIYVLPGGDNLFQSLAASITTPKYQPKAADEEDLPWWKRPSPTIIGKKEELYSVGYLRSLTFPARRVRLHPIPMSTPCTRCGEKTDWGARTMVYEMGESRPKDAPWWRDPFAAYRPPKKDGAQPLPIRPVENRAIWREFTGLFLPSRKSEEGRGDYRPTVLIQLEAVWRRDETALPFTRTRVPVRLIGLRTDMKMKIFEWEETGFDIAPRLLADEEMAGYIQQGLDFAASIDGTIKAVFNSHFGGGGKSSRYGALRREMSSFY